MAAPDGIVWGSIVSGTTKPDVRKGRIGIYTNVTNSEDGTQTTVDVEVWFWTKYSCSDGATINLKVDIGTDVTAAATTVVTKLPISHTVATGSGWSTSNQTKLYSISNTYDRATSAKTYKVYAKFSGIDMLSTSTTMYANTSFAVPILASYTVSYSANGGSGAPSSQTKWHGIDLLLSSTKPSKTGHSFNNWYSSAQKKTYQPGKYYGYNASTTMTAQWVPNTYAVTYNANGGDLGEVENQTKTYGVALTLSTKAPTRTNYNFLGWATSASATTVTYAAGASYTTNAAVTLYAVWELAYVKPRITGFSVARCDSSGVASDTGTYAFVKFNWATDLTVSSINVSWTSTDDSGSATITASGTSGTVSSIVGDGAISADATYTLTVTVADSSGSSSKSATLSGTAFTIDFLAGGKGAAFGKPAEKENALEINWSVYNNGDVYNESDIYDKWDTRISNGLVSYGGANNQIDPTTTSESLILTDHANGPVSGIFYYIQTFFYIDKTGSYSRGQLAIPYNQTTPTTGGSLYFRSYDSYVDIWSSWIRIPNASEIITLDDVYPVNSIYISYSHTSPASLIGGTWTRLQSRFLWGTTTSGTIGATGGEQKHTLTVNEMPAHNHGLYVDSKFTKTGGSVGLTNNAYGNTTSTITGKIYMDNTGGGAAHNNMPPYVNVAIWRRTA